MTSSAPKKVWILVSLALTAISVFKPAESSPITCTSRHPIQGQSSRSGAIAPELRWPNATIPYKFTETFPASYRTLFENATRHITGRTCIRFKPLTLEGNYVVIDQELGCSADIGRIGGMQTISLATGCNTLGIFIHEIVHTIGFVHEHERTDRDDYVNIHWENVMSEYEDNFMKYGTSDIAEFGVTYDYTSVMHYDRKTFSKNGLDTVSPKKAGATIGEQGKLSELDIWKINNMYCPGTVGVTIQSKFDGRFVDVKDNNPIQGQVITVWERMDEEQQRWTLDWNLFLDEKRGSLLWTWGQNGGELKVMDQNFVNWDVSTWGHNPNAPQIPNQKWTGVRITGNTFVIKNVMTSRCLVHMGTSIRLKTVSCDANDVKQQWEIQNVSG